ncbi:all-trans retinoic acid-induced differentiation factor-like [Ruditapes philippinarum]|uniref:all-trans retinoic acid-induced differentiation factor-like n=1 Tax=Ruditapes philippinarum TaxID=129788 RepID=UPI00295AAC56|nr:all-trans retinoic acid-induced differentiation factor-like [Ruditapes philippinarum]
MKNLYSTSLFTYLTWFITFSLTRCSISEVCSQCSSVPKADSFLVQFCNNSTGHLEKSCCVNTPVAFQNKTIIGVDMSSCGLKNVNGLFNDLKDLEVIMLENNTDLQIGEDDFNGLTKLDYLSLPETSQCPGGNKSWTSIEKHNNTVICLGEINLCQHNNVTCQNNNSHCVLTGPGEMECLCISGYHGYKCLRKGTFPGVSYTVTICVSTVVISGFLWCTQRRKVKRKSHTY